MDQSNKLKEEGNKLLHGTTRLGTPRTHTNA